MWFERWTIPSPLDTGTCDALMNQSLLNPIINLPDTCYGIVEKSKYSRIAVCWHRGKPCLQPQSWQLLPLSRKKDGRIYGVRKAFRKTPWVRRQPNDERRFSAGSVSCDLNERSGLRKARSTRARACIRALLYLKFTIYGIKKTIKNKMIRLHKQRKSKLQAEKK